MNYYGTEVIEDQKISINNHLNELGIKNIRKEILVGLKSKHKYISSKFFYDKKGSELFEDITRLPEYYPTRTEKSILKRIAPELMSQVNNKDIIELGSGDHSKISILLNSTQKHNLENISYIPVDVSQSAIQSSAEELSVLFPELAINGLVADFTNQLNIIPDNKERMFLFLGSTLGNFTEKEVTKFLTELSSKMNPDDSFLLGVDLVKPLLVLHNAYNDSQNITADFNKNILNVINTIIDSDFDPNDFEHKAFFNKEKSRIEMHLIAKRDLIITSPFIDSEIQIKEGENIHTENSYKFSHKQIKNFEKITGLTIKKTYTDANNWFALILFNK